MDSHETREKQELIPKEKRPPWRRWIFGSWVLILITILLGMGSLLVYKTGFTFFQMSVEKTNGLLPLSENTPPPDPNRLNILLLGLRGEDDENGGLLTDSIMVASLKKSSGQVALISIPRDLYVKMPGQNFKEKINFAYALGYEKKGSAGALLYSKVVVSQITGLHLNYAVAVDHNAFKEIIDILGGIDVYLDRPFSERTQFVKEVLIDLPAGKNHLDGQAALYFVRSRFSTSDFDRARRQQAVLLAAKDKALSLGVLTNLKKIFSLLESLGRNVRTDMPLSEMGDFIGLVQRISSQKVAHKVFDDSPVGLLYVSQSPSGAYILLPAGDNFDKIREASQEIFN